MVDRFRGRLIKSTDDGILATFDTPTRAIRCAVELVARLAESGLRIRAAIHTGEIQLLDQDVGGIYRDPPRPHWWLPTVLEPSRRSVDPSPCRLLSGCSS
jgi:hypothetical protein